MSLKGQRCRLDRTVATVLIDQLCRELPRGDTPEADDFDYGWFRERVTAIAGRCPPADGIYIWQYALWHLDQAGLLSDGSAPRHGA